MNPPLASAATTTPMSDAFGDQALLPRRELKRYMQRSNAPGLRHLALWCLCLVATGLLIQAASTASLALLLPAMFLHGLLMVHNFALMHECSHYTAFRSRRLCHVLARICGFLLFIPPLYFRYEHCEHHTYTNIPDRDPELIELPASFVGYLWFLSALPYWYGQISGIIRRAGGRLTRMEKRFIPAGERDAIVRESRWMLLAYALVIAAMLVFESWQPVLYWWLPMLLAEPVMRYIRMTEHVGRPNVADRRVNTRTTAVDRLWRFLAWNMNFHAEHHYAASVPFHALPALHERIGDRLALEPDGYSGAHAEIVYQLKHGPAPGVLSSGHEIR